MRVSWTKARFKGQADAEGCWSVMVDTPAADKVHHTVSVKSGKEELAFEKVLLGEVWLCAGQSNMVMLMSRNWGEHIPAAEEALTFAPDDNIRLFQVDRHASLEPMWDFKGEWSEANSKVLESFSSTGYFFARNLQRSLDVPVAVMITAWGGSTVNAFMSAEAIADFDDLSLPKSLETEDLPDGRLHHTTSLIYNGMVNPLVGYGIKGFLWYQGESDRAISGEIYPARFGAMVADLRSKWGYDFPVHLTEIAPYEYVDGNGAFMRETLMNTADKTPNCHIISLMGLGLKNDVHPPQKDVVGFRFARNVLEKSYGFESIHSTLSRPSKIEYRDGKVYIYLTSKEYPGSKEPVAGFEVAGEDQVFHKAVAYMVGSDHHFEVSSECVENPVAVRYQFTGWVEPSEVIYDSRGNPLPSFRSDDWAEPRE